MSHEFDAIYENGVLRPLKPVDFREHEVVSVSVTSAAEPTLAVGARHRERLLAFATKMEALAETLPEDGTTNRDHDRVIYGESG